MSATTTVSAPADTGTLDAINYSWDELRAAFEKRGLGWRALTDQLDADQIDETEECERRFGDAENSPRGLLLDAYRYAHENAWTHRYAAVPEPAGASKVTE